MPRLLIFTAKLGYQTRSFDEAARKLGVDLVFVTDRCHQLDDPWGDRAIPVHFESPDAAARGVLEAMRGQDVDGILALGDRPAVAASYVARGLGISYNHPAAVEACRSKLRMREVFREAGLRVPWFRTVSVNPAPSLLCWAFHILAWQSRSHSRPARAWSAQILAKNFSPPPRESAVCWNHLKFGRLASLISIKFSSKDTYRAGKWPSKACLQMASCASSPFLTNLIL